VYQGAAAGNVLVDLSSIQPDATRRMAERLRAETGMAWVDAPVSGGVPGAEKGTLAIMAGGAEADVERVRPVVAHLSQRFTRMGPNGAGQTTKLCNQVIVSCTLAVLAEATRLAEEAGVDAAKIPECLRGGFADSIPMQLFVPRMAARRFDPPQTRVKTMLKDVVTAQEVAAATGARLPMTETAVALYLRLAQQGLDDADLSRLITLFD
jgi:3-hydroxyisobutyrate dehydrogenase